MNTFIKQKTHKTDTVKIDIKSTNHFKPFYAMTVHKAPGMTINNDYAIYEYDIMKHDMLYVALIRIPKEEYVNLCDIKINIPRTGYIYRYSYDNNSYIGCTTDIEKQQEYHTKTMQHLSLEEQFKRLVMIIVSLTYYTKLNSVIGMSCI